MADYGATVTRWERQGVFFPEARAGEKTPCPSLLSYYDRALRFMATVLSLNKQQLLGIVAIER